MSKKDSYKFNKTESEEKYHLLVENIFNSVPLGMGIVVDRVFQRVNKFFCQITGYSEKELLGKNTRMLYISKKEYDRVSKVKYGQIRKTGKGSIDTVWKRKDGSLIDIRLSSSALDKEYLQNGVVFTAENITSRKNYEKTLEASETKYRILFESSRDAMMTLSPPSWKFTSGNASAITMFGTKTESNFKRYSPGSLSPKYQPDGALSVLKSKQMMNKAMKSGSLFFDWIHKKVNGEEFSATVLLTRIDVNGKKSLQATVRDVTLSKQSEIKLREANEIIEKSPVVAFLWKNKKDWPVEFVSENVSTIFEYSAKDFTSGKILFSKVIHKDDLNGIISDLQKTSKDKMLLEFNHVYRIVTKSGKIKWVDDRTFIRRNSKGQVTHFQGTLLDITDAKKSEEKLLTSERRFRTLFDGVADAIFIADIKTGTVVECNAVAEELTGYSKKELCSKNMIQLTPKKLWGRTKKLFKKHANGDTSHVETELCNKNGKRIHVSIKATVIELEGTKRLMSVIRDITERKNAEREVLNLSRAVEQSASSVVITDIHGNITYVNPSFTKVTGYSAKEAIGKNPRILKSGEMRKSDYKVLWDTILSGANWRGTFHNKKKNGELFWESAIISPVKDVSGKITNFIAVKEDITKLKKSQDKLIAEKERAQQYLDIVKVMIVSLDKHGKIILLNKEAEKILGDTNENLMGKDWFDVAIPESERKTVRKVFSRLMKGKTKLVENYENSVIDSKGSVHLIDWHNSTVKDSNGNIVGLISSGKVITEQRKAESELKQRYDDLEIFKKVAIERELKMIDLEKQIMKYKRSKK